MSIVHGMLRIDVKETGKKGDAGLEDVVKSSFIQARDVRIATTNDIAETPDWARALFRYGRDQKKSTAVAEVATEKPVARSQGVEVADTASANQGHTPSDDELAKMLSI